MSRWKEIWNKREAEESLEELKDDVKKTLLELKRIDGFDLTDSLDFDSFKAQFDEMRNELSWNGKTGKNIPMKSVFEVGCGAGSSLYLFEKTDSDTERTGGIDYSDAMITNAEKVLDKYDELYVAEASAIDTSKRYTSVFSTEVFPYFPDLEYAEEVVNRMIEKAEYSIGVIGACDEKRRHDFFECRRKLTPDYDEKYRDLDKMFYPKSFFIDIADKRGLDIKFCRSDMKGYWNNPFIFNVYMYKR